MKTAILIASLILIFSIQLNAQHFLKSANTDIILQIKKTDGLIALWDFKEKEGGMGEDDKHRLKEELQKYITETNSHLEVIFEKKEADTMSI